MDEYCGTIIKTNTGIERNQMTTAEPQVQNPDVDPDEPEVDANPEDGDDEEAEEEKSELGQ